MHSMSNIINHNEDIGTPMAEILLATIVLNSVVSTSRAKFMCLDISYFYLETPFNRPEYDGLKLSNIFNNIISKYKLREEAMADNGV